MNAIEKLNHTHLFTSSQSIRANRKAKHLTLIRANNIFAQHISNYGTLATRFHLANNLLEGLNIWLITFTVKVDKTKIMRDINLHTSRCKPTTNWCGLGRNFPKGWFLLQVTCIFLWSFWWRPLSDRTPDQWPSNSDVCHILSSACITSSRVSLPSSFICAEAITCLFPWGGEAWRTFVLHLFWTITLVNRRHVQICPHEYHSCNRQNREHTWRAFPTKRYCSVSLSSSSTLT